MVWASLTYMESDMTPRARFNILRSIFEEDDGEDQHGHKLGGQSKARALYIGWFYPVLTFNEPRVDMLLNRLAKLFSCRYGSYHGDQLTEEEKHRQIEDLETFNMFNHTFQTLLGEESGWKFPVVPEVQPVDPGMSVPRVQEETNMRNLRIGGFWSYQAPIAHAQSVGIILISLSAPC